MTRAQLLEQIRQKKSFLCVGLDPDMDKIPSHLAQEQDPIFSFVKEIIDATAPYAVAYKPNIAFFEAWGVKGWEALQKTLAYIPANCFTIADAKRGDIGNTSSLYAKAFFDKKASGLSFDSVTVAPYMGRDSVEPFLQFDDKWVILLGLTSNVGSQDFQYLRTENNTFLFEEVLRISQTWGSEDNLMYVVGATQAASLQAVRKIIPNHFLLVPGVGAQGGSLEEVAKNGLTKECGLLVNSSRGIIYASSGKDFAEKAAVEAKKIQEEMAVYLQNFGILSY